MAHVTVFLTDLMNFNEYSGVNYSFIFRTMEIDTTVHFPFTWLGPVSFFHIILNKPENNKDVQLINMRHLVTSLQTKTKVLR